MTPEKVLTLLSFLLLLFLFFYSLFIGFGYEEFDKVVVYENNTTIAFFHNNEFPWFTLLTDCSTSICGTLFLATPLHECSVLIDHEYDRVLPNTSSPIALISGGRCSFVEKKIRRALDAGFKGAIITDAAYGITPVNIVLDDMKSPRINICAVSVSEASRDVLNDYVGRTNGDVCFERSPDNFFPMYLLAVFGYMVVIIIGTVCNLCAEHYERKRKREYEVDLLEGITGEVCDGKGLEDGNSTSITCVICFEDYVVDDRLINLPCAHKFHGHCVEAWFARGRSVCPGCNHNVIRSKIKAHSPV